MITQLVMLSTYILLAFVGGKTFQKSKRINYLPGKILSFGLFFVALGIFCYAIRDIFIQFGMYETQLIILKLGGFIHALGCILTLWFLCQQFTSERLKRILFLTCLFIIVSVLILLTIFPWSSEVIQAPFEPFPYKVIRNFPSSSSSKMGIITEIILFIIVSVLLTSIILYNVSQLEDKKLRKKGMFYGIGFLCLLLPMIICSMVSPIYARIGYLLGAIFIYKAFKMEV